MNLHKKKFTFDNPEDSYWNETGSNSSNSLFDDLPSKQWEAKVAVANLFDAKDSKQQSKAALPVAAEITLTSGDANLGEVNNDDKNMDNFLKAKPPSEIDISNRAPSIISENSASSLPSEAQRLDLDYNRLRAEHRKLRRHLETIRHERFQPLDVKETVKRLRQGEPVTLDLYRTKSEKLQLLSAAMDTFDTDIIQRIMIFLRTTLNDTAFREILMFNPDATEEFIDYLKTIHEYEQLNTIYLHDDAHMVEIAMTMRVRSAEQKLAALRRCAQNEQLNVDVSYPIKSYVGLLERQVSIQNSDSRERNNLPQDGRMNAPLPFTPTSATLYYTSLYHLKTPEADIRNPNNFKIAMNISEKEFVWVTICTHVHKERWQEIEKMLEVKSGLFATKISSTLNWEFLFKLFFRAAHRPPVTFLEKVCKDVPELETRQKIASRYRISLQTPTLPRQISIPKPKIPFLGKKCKSSKSSQSAF